MAIAVDPETPLAVEPGVLVLAPGDAAGFWAASCASRLHASKSACVGGASARPEVLKSVAAATSAHALMLRFMIDLLMELRLGTLPAARRRGGRQGECQHVRRVKVELLGRRRGGSAHHRRP